MTSVKIEIIKIGESNKTHMNKRSSFIKDANSQTAQSNHTEEQDLDLGILQSVFFLPQIFSGSKHSQRGHI